MDSQKYAIILENSISNIKDIFQKLGLQRDNDSKRKSNVSLKFNIKN